jgi:HlyD family secretion protein
MKKKKLWVLIAGVILVSLLGLLAFTNQGTEVAVAVVEKGYIKKYVEDIGTVKCKDQEMVCIEGSGLIQNVYAEIGQQVKKGEVLLTMEKKQLEIQLNNINEKIKEIKAGFEGSEVKNYASNVEKARIMVSQTKDEYELALDDYEKIKILADAGAVSDEEVKQAEAVLKSAESAMRTAELDLQQIEANTPDSIKAVYDAQLGQITLNRQSILHNLKKQEVISPIDGIVLERNAEPYTLGVPGTVAFTIGNVDDLQIEAHILADDVANISLADEVEISERSEQKQTIKGKVVKIAPSAVSITSSLGVNQKKVAVTIEPANQSKLLKPGYEVDVKIITDRKDNVLLVPLSSLFEYKDKNCVFAVVDRKAVLRNVQKGIQDEDFVEITDGLKEGDLILSEPDINIKEGMRIKFAETAE